MSSLWGPGCATFDINLPGVTSGNLHSAEYFATGVLGLTSLFILSKLASRLIPKTMRHTMPLRVLMSPLRFLRHWMLRSTPGLGSLGHGVVVSAYVGINIVLLFTMLKWPLPLLSDFARRLGWLAVSNIALLFFLALKNTPLAILTAYSYERLNNFHQIAGWTTIALAVLHTILFIVARAQEHELCNIVDIPQHPGMLATGAMIIILITSLFLKGRRYEAWYIIHVIMACLVLFGVGLHRPDFSTYSVRAIIFTAGIFVADLLIRWTRLILNKRHQTASLHPLSNGGVMITLNRPVPRAAPGQHVRLMIGKAKFLQTHPFTIVSANPVKFVLGAQNGFTKKLYEMAIESPGKALNATLDGPYGTLPPFHKFDKVVLIAGGTGGSFTLGIAAHLCKDRSLPEKFTLELFWVFRDPAQLEWYKEELDILKNSPLARLTLHCTSTSSSNSEKNQTQQQHLPGLVNSESGFMLNQGRLDAALAVRAAVKNMRMDQRMVITACGPSSLLKDVRNATSECIHVSGPSVELHTETFGW